MRHCKGCGKLMPEEHFIRVVPEPGKEYAQAGDDVLSQCKSYARLHGVSFEESINHYRDEHTPGLPFSADSTKDRVMKSYREKTEKQADEIEGLRDRIEQAEEQLEYTREKVAEQAQEIEQLTEALEEARNTAEDKEDEIEKLSESLEQANKRIEALRDELLKNDGMKYEYWLQPNSRIGKRRK